MFEMGMDAETLSARCKLSVETIRSLLKAEIVLTPEMAEELEKATWIPAKNWLRHEEIYRKKLESKK